MENIASDYSKYCNINLDDKLTPINKVVDDMLARLEEFQTMLTFVVQDRTDCHDILTSIPNYKNQFNNELFKKIDVVEDLMSHIQNNLDTLEAAIEKAEADLGCGESTAKVTKMFTPLFKKNLEKKTLSQDMELFKTEDYFQ